MKTLMHLFTTLTIYKEKVIHVDRIVFRSMIEFIFYLMFNV